METQKTIVAWAIKTFGDLGTLPKLAARMNTEVAEVLREAAADHVDKGQVAVECADVAIVLFRIAEIIGIDLRERMADAAERETFAIGPSIWFAARWMLDYSTRLVGAVPEVDAISPHAQIELAGHARKLGGALWRLSALCGTPLDQAIDRKMKINRARKWVQGKDSGDHWVRVSDPATAPSVPQTAWNRAQAAFNLLASDPAVWATHGLPDPVKEARIVEVIAEAIAADRPIPNDAAISGWVEDEGRIPKVLRLPSVRAEVVRFVNLVLVRFGAMRNV